MKCTNVTVLVLIFVSYSRCYHWGKRNEIYIEALCIFFCNYLRIYNHIKIKRFKKKRAKSVHFYFQMGKYWLLGSKISDVQWFVAYKQIHSFVFGYHFYWEWKTIRRNLPFGCILSPIPGLFYNTLIGRRL